MDPGSLIWENVTIEVSYNPREVLLKQYTPFLMLSLVLFTTQRSNVFWVHSLFIAWEGWGREVQ